MSSSLHTLNNDNKLNIFQRVLWMIFNYINNKFLPNFSNINIKQFNPIINNDDWNNIGAKSSPSRAFSDLFWLKIDWKALGKELKDVNILDTGCGNGDYFKKLNAFSNNSIHKYCGIDIGENKNWDSVKQEFLNTEFKVVDSKKLIGYIPKDTNIFISQSAIEHFDNDLMYFSQIKDFINQTKNNVVQIHIFPSAACLKKYLWHGVRQYTPRTISKIIDIFDNDNSYSVLYKLGGGESNKLHFNYITKPLWTEKIDYRETKADEYFNLLKESMTKDLMDNSEPSFYALVIHSNFKNKIFENMPSLNMDPSTN
jgi:SAM-dependent methyltransferase